MKNGDYENFTEDIANWGDFESKMVQVVLSKQLEMECRRFDEFSIGVWAGVLEYWETARNHWSSMLGEEEL